MYIDLKKKVINLKINIKNLEETEVLGVKIGKLLKKGDIICLNGDLGAGKTTFTKSIGIGLEVEDYITSPTFSLINEYRGRVPLYHFDVYRLENILEIDDLGFDDYLFGSGVCIIEWAEKIQRFLPEDIIIINIEKNEEGLNHRLISISGGGSRFKEIIKELE